MKNDLLSSSQTVGRDPRGSVKGPKEVAAKITLSRGENILKPTCDQMKQ